MKEDTETSTFALLAGDGGFDRWRTGCASGAHLHQNDPRGAAGRGRYERSAGGARGHRNGHRERQIIGTFGAETVKVPSGGRRAEARPVRADHRRRPRARRRQTRIRRRPPEGRRQPQRRGAGLVEGASDRRRAQHGAADPLRKTAFGSRSRPPPPQGAGRAADHAGGLGAEDRAEAALRLSADRAEPARGRRRPDQHAG